MLQFRKQYAMHTNRKIVWFTTGYIYTNSRKFAEISSFKRNLVLKCFFPRHGNFSRKTYMQQ